LQLPEPALWTPHFYDGMVLVGKTWTPDFGIEESKPGEMILGGLLPAPPVKPVFGGQGAKVESYKRQMQWKGKLGTADGKRPVPVVIGETGVPFDLVGEAALANGDLGAVCAAVDAHMCALEGLFIPYFWWNYTPENSHEHGDGWNGENLSIFSTDSGGGRCLEVLVRPGLVLCDGDPISQCFRVSEGRYRCDFDAAIAGTETVFFVPQMHFKRETTTVSATPGSEIDWNEACQRLTLSAPRAGRCSLELLSTASKGST